MSLNLGFTIFDGREEGFSRYFRGALLSGFISGHNFLTLLFGGGRSLLSEVQGRFLISLEEIYMLTTRKINKPAYIYP